MADNAIIKIMTALLKHQVAKVVGDETLEVLGKEIVAIGGDKVDKYLSTWLGDKKNADKLAKAAQYAHDCFRERIEDDELSQWIVSLPIGNLPKVTEVIEKLPTSPDEKQLENSLRGAIADWKNLSPEQIEYAVNSFLFCLRSALLPIEKQTLTVIGRSVLRTEEKVDDVQSTVQRSEEKIDLLIRIAEKRFITDEPVTIESLKVEPAESWNLKHPYGLPANFTGRINERKMLNNWLENNREQPLFVLRALGGFGKSALSWYWLLHDVNKSKWTRVLWWSFYEGEASFDSFIREAFEYLVGKENVPSNPRLLTEQVLKELENPNILLIMDGFERALRAFGNTMNAAYQENKAQATEGKGSDLDCISPTAEDFLRRLGSLGRMIKSKILMTTRLTPRVLFAGASHDTPLQGMIEVELFQMQPADAVEFFQKQGIRGTHTEIESACKPYGFHPLSLRLLAGLVVKDKRKPRDISCANRYADKVSRDLIQQQHHVLEQAYKALSPALKTLLSNLACFRSSMTYEAIEAVASMGDGSLSTNLDDALDELITRGLLHQSVDSQTTTFDLHPIVRRYAYERLTAPDRTAAHERLVNYFDAVPKPQKVEKLEDLAPVIELYYHMVGAGQLDEAWVLFQDRLHIEMFFQFGAYQSMIEMMNAMFTSQDINFPNLSKEEEQARLFATLGNAYAMNGQSRSAMPLYKMANDIFENKMKNKQYLAVGLGAFATVVLLPMGALMEAEHNNRRRIDLSREVEDEASECTGHYELGRILAYIGQWEESEKALNTGEELNKKIKNIAGQSIILSYRALLFLLRSRSEKFLAVDYRQLILDCSTRSIEFANEWAQKHFPTLSVHILAYWMLGAAHRKSDNLIGAEENLSKAISTCRQINMVYFEADILLELAKLRYTQEKTEEAKAMAEEALLITERCGYILQGADVHLFLAQYALEQEKDKEKAKELAERAKELATCDGPPYYYKVAYEEAERMLEKLKN